MTVTGRDPATGRTIDLTVEDGRISAIKPSADETDIWIAPGLIDLQVNGYAGHDVNRASPAPATIVKLSHALLRAGVVAFLPTIITASEEQTIASLEAIVEARRADDVARRMIPFVHVEGPFISPEDGPRGAHPREWVRGPDFAEVQRWQSASDGLVGMITLSPHEDAALPLIRSLVAQDVRVAIGHTHASPAQIRAAADAGATLSTHLGNGAAAMLPRHPNFIWAQLADDRLTATFIADAHHLPADAFKAMLRAKTLDRAILVSDVVALGGQPPGIYEQPIGGRVELTGDGRLGVAGTPYLAGAARALNENVAIAARMADLPLADALRLAAANPARVIGAESADISVGRVANLIQFRWAPGASTLEVLSTFLAGKRFV